MANSKEPRNFSWIDEGKLAAFGCPSKRENLRFLLENSVNYLVTLSPETTPPVFLFPDIKWVEMNIKEFQPPNKKQIDTFINTCETAFSQGKAVGVHCRMGRGRTGVMAACYLIKFHNMSPQKAMDVVREKRPGSIETYSQEDCVINYYMAVCQEKYRLECFTSLI